METPMDAIGFRFLEGRGKGCMVEDRDGHERTAA